MIHLSPTVRMSIGLMFITLTVLLLGNFIGLIPDESHVTMEVRKSTTEAIAVRCTYAARRNNVAAIKKTIDEIVELNPDILSVGIRSVNGKYLAQTENHHDTWTAPKGEDSSYRHWQVPIYQNDKRWATLEISFAPKGAIVLLGYHVSPFALLLIFFAAISFTAFVLYMRRSLRYLDPSSVMPGRVKYALDTLTEGVLLLDKKERVVLANSVFTEKLGCTAKELMGYKASKLEWLDPETNKPPEEVPWIYTISEGEKQSGNLLNLYTKTNGVRNFVVNGAPILDDKGKCRGAVVTFDDVTELEKQSFQLSRMVELLKMSRDDIKHKNKELKILATHDSLTNCLNRRAFFEIADQSMTAITAGRSCIALIMMDVDLFKAVNDTFGHAIGDQVIQYIARTLQATVRGDDEVCRYGGEEFCLLLPNCDSKNAALIAEKVRARIESQSAQEFSETPGICVTASFGVSDSTLGARSIEELLGQADKAMYKAKEGGRNRVVIWEKDKENEFLLRSGQG